jgi:hypothetical protein
MSNQIQESIAREAPDIEARKVGLMDSAKALTDAANLRALSGEYLTPDYEVAGMAPDQLAALQMGRQGIGAYQPFLTSATQGVATGANTLGESANLLRGADTRRQFGAAQAAMNQAAVPLNQMGAAANLATAGTGYIDLGASGMSTAQQLALGSLDPLGFQQGIGTLYGAAGLAQRAADLGDAPLAEAATFAAPASIAAERAAAEAAQAGRVGELPQVASRDVSTRDITAAQTGYSPSLQAFQMGPAERVSTQSVTGPGTLQQYMSPYQQNVTDIALREAQRQDDISRQTRNAMAVRSGAFGGSRQGIVESEAARNLAQLKADIQSRGLQEGFQSAQQQFNTEQQARLAAQQANQQAGLTVGQQNLASQQGTQQLQTQAGLQTALANLSASQQTNVQNEANRLQSQGMNQTAALQAAMANQQTSLSAGATNAQLTTQANLQNAANALQASGMNQQAALAAAKANQEASLQAGLEQARLKQQTALANQAMKAQYGMAEAQFGLQAAQQLANAGTGQIGATAQQAGLEQNAANLYGSLANQQAGLASLYGNIGSQQANILGQQSQLGQSMAQGIGNLAGQQFNIGAQMAQGLGSLGTQQANIGMQNAALGQQAQAQGQQDTNFLFNLGSSQQRQAQSELDAQRQNTLQQNMQPYQQMGFLSDIYRGAPTSQMASQQQAGTAPSAFQQAAGLGIAGVSAAAAGARAGIL